MDSDALPVADWVWKVLEEAQLHAKAEDGQSALYRRYEHDLAQGQVDLDRADEHYCAWVEKHWGKPAAEGYPTGKGDEPEAVLEEVRSWCGTDDLAAHAWMDKAAYVAAWQVDPENRTALMHACNTMVFFSGPLRCAGA